MSYDYLIMPRACDHRIAAERLAIGPDLRTLYSIAQPSEYMTSPIQGESTVILWIDGVQVPRDHPDLGWTIQPDPFSVAPDWKSKLVFNRAVRLKNVIIEVSYVTTGAYCAKCDGTNSVADFQIGVDGARVKATKRTKLVQRCLKFLLTSQCPFYPGLTCKLKTFVGRKYGKSLTTTDFSFEVNRSLDNLKRVQEMQSKYQALDQEEILRSVNGVKTTRDESDPTVVRVSASVSSPTGTQNTVNIGLRVNV